MYIIKTLSIINTSVHLKHYPKTHSTNSDKSELNSNNKISFSSELIFTSLFERVNVLLLNSEMIDLASSVQCTYFCVRSMLYFTVLHVIMPIVLLDIYIFQHFLILTSKEKFIPTLGGNIFC